MRGAPGLVAVETQLPGIAGEEVGLIGSPQKEKLGSSTVAQMAHVPELT